MARKISAEQRKYWAGIFTAVSQVTFAGAWVALFIPVDLLKGLVIVLNISATALFWLIGWYIIKKLP